MAFSATAVRYSDHSFFGGRQQEALGTYARTAWHIILKQAFSSEQGLDLNAVQATNLLAAVDFTGRFEGRKILACRLTDHDFSWSTSSWVGEDRLGYTLRPRLEVERRT